MVNVSKRLVCKIYVSCVPRGCKLINISSLYTLRLKHFSHTYQVPNTAAPQLLLTQRLYVWFSIGLRIIITFSFTFLSTIATVSNAVPIQSWICKIRLCVRDGNEFDLFFVASLFDFYYMIRRSLLRPLKISVRLLTSYYKMSKPQAPDANVRLPWNQRIPMT